MANLYKHRYKFVGIGTSAVLVYGAKWYLKSKYDKWVLEYQMRQTLTRGIHDAQRDTEYTVNELWPLLVTSMDSVDVSSIFAALKNKTFEQSSGANMEVDKWGHMNKAELWDELKYQSLIKWFAMYYSVSLLIILTRCQLNILTKNDFLQEMVHLDQTRNKSWYHWVKEDLIGIQGRNKPYSKDKDVSNKHVFLSLSWWLINQGWKNIVTQLESIIFEEFDDVSPKDIINYEDTCIKFQNVCDKMLNSKFSIVETILPAIAEDEIDNLIKQTNMDPKDIDKAMLQELLDEIKLLVASSATPIVLRDMVVNVTADATRNRVPFKEADAQYKMAQLVIMCKSQCEMAPTFLDASATVHSLNQNENLSKFVNCVYGNMAV